MSIIRGHKKRNLLLGSSTAIILGGVFLWKITETLHIQWKRRK